MQFSAAIQRRKNSDTEKFIRSTAFNTSETNGSLGVAAILTIYGFNYDVIVFFFAVLA